MGTQPVCWEGWAGYLRLKPVNGCGAESIQELRSGLEPAQAAVTRVTFSGPQYCLALSLGEW